MQAQDDARKLFILNRTEELLRDDPLRLIIEASHRGEAALIDLLEAKTKDECIFARNRLATICRIEAAEIAMREFDKEGK